MRLAGCCRWQATKSSGSAIENHRESLDRHRSHRSPRFSVWEPVPPDVGDPRRRLIDPTDTRNTLGMALSASLNAPIVRTPGGVLRI
jgi:hypothetical protein